MSITYDPATRVAHTTLNMTGLSPGGTAVAVVLNGSCAAPGGVAWRGAPFTADATQALESLKRIEGVSSDLVLPGHGDPWTGGVEEAVRLVRESAASNVQG
jgi:glyoxylase-like metal-dependent hydrolase (beta-lactamase superfamily II)